MHGLCGAVIPESFIGGYGFDYKKNTALCLMSVFSNPKYTARNRAILIKTARTDTAQSTHKGET